MKEIRKPKFMQAAAVKRGHGIFAEICIAIALFIVGSMAGGIIQVPAMMANMLGNNEYIDMITSGQPDINKMMQLISNMPEWMTIVTLISELLIIVVVCLYCRFVEKRKLNTLGFKKKGAILSYFKGMILSLTNMVSKLGFDVKPVYSDESDFYELSNRITLGITEKNAIDNLNSICEQIVKQERTFRQELIEYEDFEDKIFRAMGTLKMARKLTSKEFYSLISLVRLGISMGSFDENYETVSKLLHEVGTATIMSASDEGLTVDDTDKIRAQYVRESLS